jgi:Putative binding domain, N-terminal
MEGLMLLVWKRAIVLLFGILVVLLPSRGFAQVTSLKFRPIAAEYSPALDRIIMVASNPNQLHIYAPGLGDTVVALAGAPLSMAVSPDGLHAAVGHDTSVSYINLSTASVERTFTIASPAQTLTLSSTWIYVLPTYEGNVFSLNISTGAVSQLFAFYGSGARFNAAVNALYGTRDGISPNDILRYDISTGPITNQTDSIYHGDYPVCGPVFFSLDGSRIYDGCATVFHASNDASLDMRYVTTFAGITSMRSLAESAAIKRIALIQSPSNFQPVSSSPISDSVVLLYDTDYLNPAGQFTLADFQAPGVSYKAHGKWVFFNAAASMLYVVAQADQSSGLLNDYALQTIALGQTSPCGANFAAPTADVIAEGSLGNVNIIASAACSYQAVSTVPWIQIVSGDYGSGSGTLTYIARANTDAARSGTITIGPQTFTIRQAAAVQKTGLTRLPYNVAGATYDKPLDKLILISANPNELHLYDARSQSDQIVPLPKAPLSVSVRPDGAYAAVGHDGWVSYVNLQSGTIEKVFSVITDVHSVLLAGNGYMYLFPARDWSDIFSLEIASGVVTPTSAIYNGRVPRLSNDGTSMYVGGNWFSKWSIAGGVAKLTNGFSSAVSSTCGNLWLTEDGNRMLTACGSVFRVSAAPSEDLQPNGSFGSYPLMWADESALQGLTAILAGSVSIQGPPYYGSQSATQLQIYGDAFLDFKGFSSLPQIVADKAYDSYGQFVFWNGDETSLIVVVKADLSANLASSYAVAVLAPALSGAGAFTAAANGAASRITTGAASPTTNVGSTRLQLTAGASTPAGLAIFASRQHGILVSEATVPLSSVIQSGRIYAEVSPTVNTGVAIANPNPTAANITFYFTDGAGKNFNSGKTTIPANGQIAAFLDQAPFNSGGPMNGTFTFSSDLAVGAIALRGLTNDRAELLWTTLPVFTLGGFSASGIFPSFADGAGWSSQVVLVNSTDSTLSGNLQFYPQASFSPVPPPPVVVTINGQSGNSFAYSIPPRSSINMKTSGAGSNIAVGYVRTVPSQNSFYSPAGLVIFSEKNSSGVTVSEAGVPGATLIQDNRLYAEVTSDSAQIRTGFAIANTSTSAVNSQLELFRLDGTSTGLTSSLTIQANGQVQMFVNEVRGFENLPTPFQGVLKISSLTSSLSVIGLRGRYNERGDFLMTTTMPMITPNSFGPPAVALFPHVVDGGGFSTQFILFNGSSQKTSGTLQFFTQSGQPASLSLQ